MLVVLLASVLLTVYAFNLDYKIVQVLFKNEINYSQYRAPAILAVVVSVLNFMLISFYFTSESIKLLKKYNIARIALINGVAILLLYWMQNVDSVSLRLKATYIIELVLLAVFAKILYSSVRVAFDKKIAMSSVKMAYPIMLSAIFGIVINFGDKFFLEKYGNFSDLSVYYLAFSFASFIPMIFSSLQNAWLPLFLKEKDITKNFIQTKKLIRQLGIGFILLSFLIWAGVKVLLVFHIIPTKYNEVIFVLPILLISQTISTLIPLYTNYLIYFEKTYIASLTGFFVCFIIFGMSLLLIPKLGIYGAALVSLIANTVYLLIYFFIISRLVKKYLQTGRTT
jgi:O-antigen/teichoic acid export membrane protein